MLTRNQSTLSGWPVRSSAWSLIRCNAPAPSTDTHSCTDMVEAKKIIQDKTSRFTKAHITGDTTFLNNIFTTDARIFAPGSDVVTGRRSIEAINAEYVSYGIRSSFAKR